jgi:chromosome partitioning protein
MARDNMARDAMAMAVDYQDVIIDGPPGAGKITRAAIIASDVVLVPIEPSGASIWASRDTIAQIQEAQSYKPSLKRGSAAKAPKNSAPAGPYFTL